jgi:RNase P/RNase MRP subunit p29
MSVKCNKEVKVVFVDGNLNTGVVRSIRGEIIDETETTITVLRSNGKLTIGKQFLIKVEDWG